MNPLHFAVAGIFFVSIVRADAQNAVSGASKVAPDKALGVSLATLLQLHPKQSERLSRLHHDFAARRSAQETPIARAQNQMGLAPALDARRLAQSEREAEAARQKISADWKHKRTKARQILSPVQLSQLDSLINDPRYRVRPDYLYQLLVAPINPFVAPNDEARRNWLEARRLGGENDLRPAQGVGSYGVYGGYSYGGPQLGVYGGYHQGPVGVHAGIGLGGPSVGISIGRVFGVGRR